MGAAAAHCGCSEADKLEDRSTAYLPAVPDEDVVHAAAGTSSSSSGKAGKLQEAVALKTDLDQDKRMCFKVHITKTGLDDMLGMDVKHIDGKLEVVTILPNGAIGRGNAANQAKDPNANLLKVQDLIYQVNDVFESDTQMVAECRLKTELLLHVRRDLPGDAGVHGQQAAGQGGGCSAEDGPASGRTPPSSGRPRDRGHEQSGRFKAELLRMSELRRATALQHIGLRPIMDNLRPDGAKIGPNFSLAVADMQDSLKSSVEKCGYALGKDELDSLEKVSMVLDVNKDQKVNFYEALAMLPLFCRGALSGNGEVLFKFLALDKDTRLTLFEFRQYMRPVIQWIVKATGCSCGKLEALILTITCSIFEDISGSKDQHISLEQWLGWLAGHDLYEVTKDELLNRECLN